MKRLVPLAVAVLGITACQDASGPAPLARPSAPYAVNAARGIAIPGDYIITLRDNVTDVDGVARSLSALHRGALKHLYKSALKGFAVQNISEAAAAAIAADPRVERVEADQVMTAIGTESPATWGIDRIDQNALPLDNTYSYANDGSNVTVYIIDTGINFGHVDFGGRASTGVDEVTIGGSAADCNGHGTHVSGTVGGTTYGVAKNVQLVAVRVLNCAGSGTTSGVVAGIDWVTANHVLPAAANMSLGGGLSTTLNQAVARAVASGVTFAVAAGNSTANACNTSPSSEPSAITVGATDVNDTFAYFSNYGSCVDINAPGVSITSDWYSSNTATNTISGTSMATPHVTGAAALYLSANPTATPAEVTLALTSNATPGAIGSLPAGTVNLLLYTGFIGGSVPPPPPPPPPLPSTASFTKSCSGVVTCSFDASASTDATSYSWDFGDGATASGVTTSHKFGRNRNYTVTLTTQPASSTSTASTSVTCGPKTCS
jgi:subtilisin family serine protease